MRTLPFLWTILFTLLLGIFNGEVLGANLPALFEIKAQQGLSLGNIQANSPAPPRKQEIIFNKEAIKSSSGAQFRIPLSDNENATMTVNKVIMHKNGGVTWIASVLQTSTSKQRMFISFSGGRIFGSFTSPTSSFQIRTEESKFFLVTQPTSNRIPGGFENDILIPVRPAEAQTKKVQPPTAALELQTTIDIMLIYTQSMIDRYGDTTGVEARLNTLIAKANQAFIDSQVAITFRLVHSVQINYSETASNNTALNDLTNGSGLFSGVSALRNSYGADLVALIRSYSPTLQGSCGLAWLNGANGTDISNYGANGYATVLDGDYQETVGQTTYTHYCSEYTLAHEFGHNMGSTHDIGHASSPGAYPYSYGYGSDGVFGTIMSYINPEVAYFSNPSLNFCNGNSCGVADTADNARSLNNTRSAVGAFKGCQDQDSDSICTPVDNCPAISNQNQLDSDGDGVGDACDPCPLDNPDDPDGDGVCTSVDICPAGNDATDTDGDTVPDACDPCPLDNPDDPDGDGVCTSVDICPSGNDATDTDGDTVPDACDVCPGYNDLPDADKDGVPNCIDGSDTDGDGISDRDEVLCGSDPADNASRCSLFLPFLFLLD